MKETLPNLNNLSREEKRRLLAVVLQERASRPASFPLSFAQQRLWFIQQLEPESAAYNVPIASRLVGPLDVPALERGLNEVARRHEILRTSFILEDGNPVQVVAAEPNIHLELIDPGELLGAEREAEALRLAQESARRPFDLERGPLLRALLVRLGAEEHLLVLTLHHIVCDAWSLGVLLRELGALYEAYREGLGSPLGELPIQYADFALWQRERLTGELLDRELGYWRGQLGGELPVLALPTDRPRPAVQGHRGGRRALLLPELLTEKLKTLGRQEGATLFMTLLASFQALLSRYSGQEDLVVGTPIAGRTRTETEGLIGFFVNTLALRADLSGEPSFRELLGRVRESALGAYAHQEVPFGRLVEELRPGRSLSHAPLFQVMFALQNTPREGLELEGLRLSPVALDAGTAKFDLTLEAVERGEELTCELEYDAELFEAGTAERLLGHYERLLEAAAVDPDRPHSHLPLLTPQEERQLLVEWNDTARDYPTRATIHELFEQQAGRTPEATALECGDERLSYQELNRRANQLAHLLRRRGVGPGVPVGLYLERSAEMLVALLGVLKAGGAYLPLDPSNPQERLGFILEDAQAPVLLTESRLAGQLSSCRAEAIHLDAVGQELARETETAPAGVVTADDLAYVLYTSGSTGKPKGVEVGHRAVVNLLCAMRERPGLGPRDVMLAVTTLSFDIAGLELLLPVTVGARVVVAGGEDVADGRRLSRLLTESGATVMDGTPATWRMLIESGWGGDGRLKMMCGGEALAPELAAGLLERGGQLWNLYGPTETTIYSTGYRVKAGGRILIGRPVANTQIYVLDQRQRPVPVGVAGELYIGGDGLARGYLNRPELTQEKFVPHPFGGEAGARLYRTGDLVRYLSTGELEYLGRIDHQVKIRGFRIELGEIESALSEHAAVAESVVAAGEDGRGERRLVAYVVPAGGAAPAAGELRGHLKKKLPDYMIPSQFVALDKMPRTSSGKVDRRALPAPGRPESEVEFVAPRNAVERALADVWAEVLGVERVGAHDNFFELGGHSLLATQIISRVRDTFQVDLPLRRLFESPTLAGLAGVVEHAGAGGSESESAPIARAPRDRYRVTKSALQEK